MLGIAAIALAAPLVVACSSNTTPSTNANAAAGKVNNSAAAAATKVSQAANAAASQVSQAANAAATQVSQAATAAATAQANGTVPQNVRSSWASVYSDAQSLLNQLQSQNAPQLKQSLLNKCATAQQQANQNDATLGSKIQSLCTMISNTDVSNNQAWNQVRQQLNNLNSQIGS